MDYTIRVGGEAGQGILTVGGTLARLFARSGYHVFTHQDYESRIRGGHNFYQIRTSDKPVTSSRDSIDMLVALDRESITQHESELSENGIILYDSSALKTEYDKPHFYDIPFESLAVKHGGSSIMASTVSVGAILGILGIKLDILYEIIRNAFAKKSEDIVQKNINAATAGHDFAASKCEKCSDLFSAASTNGNPKMLIAGNDAIGLGAVASGLKFYSAYPMSPSTGIMNYIAGKEAEYGIIVEQAEDEISAINMSLGASFAGIRSMTGTSGGGFALMTEGLSLAGITEIPVVIALAQRPGPATGLPTRTEQGDLQFALYGGHGEFPRIIYAPGTPEQAFHLTNKAFEMAEKYQVPVIIMTDQYLADTQWTFDSFDTSKLQYTDYRVRGEKLESMTNYKRYAYTETGISPMAVPGKSEHLVVVDSDEHDEEGHMVEDAETRMLMTEKRLFKKNPLIQKEMAPPIFYGSENPEIVITGWGSTYGVIKETVDHLAGNHKISMLYFNEIYPLPLVDKFVYVSLLQNAKLAVCVENNASGQFANLIRTETGYHFTSQINRYDGRPFTLDSFMGDINAFIKGI
jgi:2-oxoglutarate ferredoxin oxidoreductase subunit alpha